MSKFESLNTLQEWLDKYLNFEKLPQKNIFWLDTMEYFCGKFGHPENYAPCFHVAGSKGKGSVSAFISSILDSAGYKTGLYTSPHILDFAERIVSARGLFEKETYDRAVEEIISGINKIPPEELPGQRPITWFELVTLFGFLAYRQAKVDYSVFEVGLGGRLDATNVVKPKISVITPIELEHTEFLGDTIEKIAYEKGGIIKENTPVIIAAQKPQVREIFRQIAAEKNAEIYFIDELVENLTFNFAESSENAAPKMKVSFTSKLFSRQINANLRLLGEFQAYNGALAACAVKLAVPEISEEQIETGLEAAVLPGRFEIVEKCEYAGDYPNIPALILDGAHTVNSVGFTMDTLEKLNLNENKNLLFAAAADKDVKDIAPLFSNKFQKVLLTIPGLVKKSDLHAVETSFTEAKIPYDSDENFEHQIKKALELSNASKSVLVVTGSFYLVSEVKKFLSK